MKKNQRVVISNLSPLLEEGNAPIKRIVDDEVVVSADILCDSHWTLMARVLYRLRNASTWQISPMALKTNDRWEGSFTTTIPGIYLYTIEAGIDYFASWKEKLQKKYAARQDIWMDLKVGVELIESTLKAQKNENLQKLLEELKKQIDLRANVDHAFLIATDNLLDALIHQLMPAKAWDAPYAKILSAICDMPKARFSTWYELFPRSASRLTGTHGNFKDCEKLIPRLSKMGFDVLYFPPIHPIGQTMRKGPNNQPISQDTDQAQIKHPSSPWAIGLAAEGHKSIHSQLGTVEDFMHLMQTAKLAGMDLALDLAFQCSPDHPYVQEHPKWFRQLPDGSIQHAENPPKKYEDIVPFDFDTDLWEELWEELRQIAVYWIGKGVKIFRVDNPHTKPFAFWQWFIASLKEEWPDLIFLSEAFTRSKVMYQLAQVGFTQSYTYFTWRHTKKELTDYMEELTSYPIAEFFRPNFWPNTPDILPEELQHGGKAAFQIRLMLAATLSSNYGIYGPAFELLYGHALPGTEEYADAEKYELKDWDYNSDNIDDFISQINAIRLSNAALQQTQKIKFCEIDNDQIIAYLKTDSKTSNAILVVINLDPFTRQIGTLKMPLADIEIDKHISYSAHELLTDRRYTWEGETQKITLDPIKTPGYIFRLKSKRSKETNFDYF